MSYADVIAVFMSTDNADCNAIAQSWLNDLAVRGEVERVIASYRAKVEASPSLKVTVRPGKKLKVAA